MPKPVIVCVDDEVAVLDSLRRELSEVFEDSCEIETAMGGKDAIALVHDLIEDECDLSVIIADYLMPDIKGDEVLQQVHQLSPQTLKIMLTGQANVDGISNAINTAQLYHYIAKPWQPENLQLTVREALNSYQLAKKIKDYQQTLERKVEERTQELSATLHTLQTTQAELIQAEKMAALGQLVAGVAHEINTPVGNALLAASVLNNETGFLTQAFDQGGLKRSALVSYLQTAQESSGLILQNLHGAAALIQNFKQVAVDQTSHEQREFQIIPYIESVLTNLEPKLKQTRHRVTVSGDAALKTTSYPGALSQVATNFVMNSLLHAYQPGEAGQLKFNVTQQQDRIILEYTDDGCGIPVEDQPKIFEPFFTTGRDRGGSGLGLHIVHNLVTQTLGGTVSCQSEVAVGTRFKLQLPLTLAKGGSHARG